MASVWRCAAFFLSLAWDSQPSLLPSHLPQSPHSTTTTAAFTAATSDLRVVAPVATMERDAKVARADATVRRDQAAGARLGEAPFEALARAAAATPPTAATLGPRLAALWGLARVSQRGSAPLAQRYAPSSNFSATLGDGVTIYVLDSGVASTAELAGRVTPGPDFVSSTATATPPPDDAPFTAAAAVDCDGHGTHVAALGAGTTVGVAPRARVVAPRVLECDGGGRASAVARAVDWVVAYRQGPAVIVLSLGASVADGGVAAMEAALEGAAAAGVVVVAAAGNDRGDACAASPARLTSSVITVAASDRRPSLGGGGVRQAAR